MKRIYKVFIVKQLKIQIKIFKDLKEFKENVMSLKGKMRN